MSVARIAADETFALRHQVLRPNQTLADCAYPLDHEEATMHFGYFLEGKLIGVASVYREDREDREPETELPGWRLRGMAVYEEHRGGGYGSALLQAVLTACGQQGTPCEVWCNGRSAVRDFYTRHGFTQVGDEFDLPPIGPHVLLRIGL